MKSIQWLSCVLLGAACSVACGGHDFGEEQLDSTQQASSIHLKGGPSSEPAFTDNGLTLSVSGELSGLGNQNITVNLDATGVPRATCTNPAGSTQPPGQNPASVTLSGTQHIAAGEIKNGTVPFSLTSAGPESPIRGAPDCPNRKWTEAITDIAFTSATITVTQGGNSLTVVCTFSPATSDGSVPASQVECTSS